MIIFAKAHPATRTMIGGDPSPAQAASGDYPKLRQEWQGLTIAIEHPEGTVREGVDETGKHWRTVFRYAYGEILGTTGLDGDPVDVFIGSYPDAPEVYIVQQMKRKQWDVADEQKCMINFASVEEAMAAYLGHYDDPRFFGGITAMPVDEFVAKVRATKDKPAMIKAILFFKAHVGPYLRGGKIVNVNGYQGRPSRAHAAAGQLPLFVKPTVDMSVNRYKGKHPVDDTPDLFDEPKHSEPTSELIAEHERLVDVLNSPSHEDDKVEAKKQAAELKEYKEEAAEAPAKPHPTETPEFKRWFGNSKVRNDDGAPKVLYHGTPHDFSEFKPGGADKDNMPSGHAIWLSPDADHQPAAHNIGWRGEYKAGTNVMPVYVKMERPLVIDDKATLDWARTVFAGGSIEFPHLMPKKWLDEVTRDSEYDGIIFDGQALGWGAGSTEYLVFDPRQVKSAIGNSGAFDPDHPDITKSDQPVIFLMQGRAAS